MIDTEYQCNKSQHNKLLLSRRIKDMPRPDGNVDVVMIETCPICVNEAVRRALDKIRDAAL